MDFKIGIVIMLVVGMIVIIGTVSAESTQNLYEIWNGQQEINENTHPNVPVNAYFSYKLYYEEGTYDPYYVIMWSKAQAEGREDVCTWPFGKGNVRTLEPKVWQYDDGITNWDPNGCITTNTGLPITLELGVEHKGVNAGISTTFYTSSEKVCSHVSSNMFSSEWIGNSEDPVYAEGLVEWKSNDGQISFFPGYRVSYSCW